MLQFPLDSRLPDQVQILKIMDQVASEYSREPLIREFTVRLMRGIANNDLRAQVRRVVDFVKQNVTYIKDPNDSEYLVSPIVLLENYNEYGHMAGDCDDHVILMNSMLGSVGIASRAAGVKFGGSQEFNHVISAISCCGTTFLVDPCAKGQVQPVYNETLFAP